MKATITEKGIELHVESWAEHHTVKRLFPEGCTPEHFMCNILVHALPKKAESQSANISLDYPKLKLTEDQIKRLQEATREALNLQP